MDAELKAKWVAALRSGEYKQCSFKLHDGERYCCLGVVYKLALGSDPSTTWSQSGGKTPALEFVDGPSPVTRGKSIENELVNMNDGGDSFAKIADWIEKNL